MAIFAVGRRVGDRRLPSATLLLVVINCLVYLAQDAALVDRLGFRPLTPTWSGAFGYMFVHANLDHLLGNMALLLVVGGLVERALGASRHLAFYVLAGLGAASFDLAFDGARVIAGVGASGAVAGTLAIFVLIYRTRKIGLPRVKGFAAPAIVVLPWWLASQVFVYACAGGAQVDHLAHLGGFLTGALLIVAERRLRRTNWTSAGATRRESTRGRRR